MSSTDRGTSQVSVTATFLGREYPTDPVRATFRHIQKGHWVKFPAPPPITTIGRLPAPKSNRIRARTGYRHRRLRTWTWLPKASTR